MTDPNVLVVSGIIARLNSRAETPERMDSTWLACACRLLASTAAPDTYDSQMIFNLKDIHLHVYTLLNKKMMIFT